MKMAAVMTVVGAALVSVSLTTEPILRAQSAQRGAAPKVRLPDEAAGSDGVVGALMSDGRFRRSFLGVAGGPRPLPPRLAQEVGRRGGVEVVQVVEGSPAARGGIRGEDLILEVDGVPVEDMGDLQRLMTGERIGRAVELRVFRGGRVLSLSVSPTELAG